MEKKRNGQKGAQLQQQKGREGFTGGVGGARPRLNHDSEDPPGFLGKQCWTSAMLPFCILNGVIVKTKQQICKQLTSNGVDWRERQILCTEEALGSTLTPLEHHHLTDPGGLQDPHFLRSVQSNLESTKFTEGEVRLSLSLEAEKTRWDKCQEGKWLT